MQTQGCDVIGCGRPAFWRRLQDETRLGEEFLCAICWTQQRRNKSHVACYIPYHADGVLSLVALEERSPKEPRDDVIIIGA